MSIQGHKWIPHRNSAQYTVLRWMTEDGSWFPSSCSQTRTNANTNTNTNTPTTKSRPVSLIERHFHYSRQEATIQKAADSEWPVCMLVRWQACKLANQSFKTRCGQILIPYIISSSEPIAQDATEKVSENPCVPWKVRTSRRYCVLKNEVLHLNSSTVSQTLWPSFY